MKSKPLISFDYAIKYLLKDKGDYEIVEGFISALLQTQGYKPIKIISLLDTESNKENPYSKRSLADLVVEDTDHVKYIVEIERNLKHTYMQKACFNTSRLLVDQLSQKVDYSKIVKIIHITLLYFPIGDNPIYHGKTIIKDIVNQKPLQVLITDKETQKTIEIPNIFPEYFIISVPQFNDILEKEIDDWLYVLKHDEIPANFHSAYMLKVEEKLNYLKMTQEERDDFTYYMKKIYDERDGITAALSMGRQEGLEEGLEKGLEKGREEGMAKILKKMIEKGNSIEQASELTGLNPEEIKNLLKTFSTPS